MGNKKYYQLGVGIIISIICLWLAVRTVPFKELKTIVAGANYIWLIPAVIAQFLSIIARSIRWTVLLEQPKRLQDSFWSQGIGYLFTNIFPFRLGEVARVIVMAEKCQLPVMKVAGTAIVERLLDVGTMVFILIFILPLMHVPVLVIRSGLIFGIIVLIAIFIIVFLARFYGFSVRLINGICKLSPHMPKDKLIGLWDELVSGLTPLLQPKIGAQSILWSFVSWSFSALVYYSVILSFQSNGKILEAVFMMVALSLAVAIPSSPGFIGVFQYIGQQALVIPFGLKYTDSIALAITISSHLVYYLLSTLLGIIALLIFGLSISMLNKLIAHKQVETANGGG